MYDFGAEDTMLKSFLAGVRKFVSPWHVKTYVGARCPEQVRVGRASAHASTKESLLDCITRLVRDRENRQRLQSLKCKWLVAVGYAIGGLFAATTVNAQDTAACVKQPVVFDGLTPLSYAAVSVAQGAKAYLHAKYPLQCAAGNPASCQSPTYVLPGDVVAIGKICGAWAYVQYIGAKRITSGWVRTTDLAKPNDISPRRNLMSSGNTGKEPVFTLTRGKSVPVCEAYLQRLNQTEFEQPAYCGRPEDDRVPGFHRLNRVLVSPGEVKRLADLVVSITFPLTAIDSRYFDEMNENGGVFNGTPSRVGAPNIDSYATWRYDPPIDIDNDGMPDNVLIWHLDDAVRPYCGLPVQGDERIEQYAFVMSPDGSTIDQARTIQVFGHPDGGYAAVPGMQGLKGPSRFLKSLRLIGDSYSVFQYRDLYYFETFYDHESPVSALGDLEDKRIGSAKLQDTLAVFLRKGGKTLPVCEYYVTE